MTYPSSYRTVTVARDGSVEIATDHVTEIDDDTGGVGFPKYAFDYLYQGLLRIVTAQLVRDYGVRIDDADWLAPLITAGFMAHYAGDETPIAEILGVIGSLMGHSDPTVQMLGGYLGTLWTDLAPGDLALSLRPWPPAARGGLPIWFRFWF